MFAVLVVADADVPATVERLIADDRVDAVTLTGSERAGRAVAAAAGRAIKPSVLELGGSDPFVVLDDADLPATVAAAVRSRFGNAGQSCIAAKRFVVHRAVAERFVADLARAAEALVVGDPADPATDIGPLARPDLVEALHRQVRESLAAGATLVTGGTRTGNFHRRTVLAGASTAMPVCAEETFGPVAAVLVAGDDADAVRIANDSRWGLGASVWTADPARGRAVAAQVVAGTVLVNDVVASDPKLPFGGIRASGYGRELGRAGLHQFVNVQTWGAPA